jgi:hypothetical protein
MRSEENVPYWVDQPHSAAVMPTLKTKARPIRAKRGQMAFLTPDETLAVLKAAREHATRDWAMILPAYRHGL